MHARYPERIVCLSAETTEVLYLLGEEHRIAGISGYTVRPARARREKPMVAAFTSAKTGEIMALKPDLAVGFSDLQADLTREVIKRGVEVHVFNQRSVQGIFNMVLTLGSMVGASSKAETLIASLEKTMDEVRQRAGTLARRPKVYFEEWYDPLISAIKWVSELIECSGGTDCFADLAGGSSASERIIREPEEIVRRQPDIIIGSWCGKKFRPEVVCGRPGWSEIPAVRTGNVWEIKSAHILQPGPGVFTEGLRRLQEIVMHWEAGTLRGL